MALEDVKEFNNQPKYSLQDYLKFILLSLLGVILFFFPVTINGLKSIPLDHFITFINNKIPIFGSLLALAIAIIGGLLPWIKRDFKKDVLTFVISIFRFLGIPLCLMGFFNMGPKWLMKPDLLPFIWQKITVPVSLIVPIGSIILTFLIGYGLLEFIGIILKPVMRPTFKLPGKAVIDAVASFVGSFSIAMLITDKLYREGKYSFKEAVIIMTGFSTVSATFMIIVAKTAQFMDIWNFYFWSTLIICFTVTALTVRIFPINKLENKYVEGKMDLEETPKGNILKVAFNEGVKTAANSKSIFKNLFDHLLGGIKMCFVLTPAVTSIGMCALLLVKMTPIFDIIGYIFLPITFLLSFIGLENPFMVAKASSVVLGEMFIPNLLVKDLPAFSRYIIAVVSVSSIIFFAGFIPCFYATSVKLKPWKLLLIWFERTVISIILAGIVGAIYF